MSVMDFYNKISSDSLNLFIDNVRKYPPKAGDFRIEIKIFRFSFFKAFIRNSYTCRIFVFLLILIFESDFKMIVASATLHNFNVKKLAQKLMSFPSWVDLKGEDAVPDTVHHCVALVDPKKDQSWFQ